MNALAKLSAATTALAEAKTLDEVMGIRDIAVRAKAFARAVGMGLDAQNSAAEVKLRAERGAGKLLRDMEKAKGTRGQLNGRNSSGGSRMEPPENDAPKLSDLGVSKKQAFQWQTASDLPEETFEQYVAETKSSDKELTTTDILKLAKAQKRENDRRKKQEAIKEGTVVVDTGVWHGDMQEMGPRIEDNSVDLFLTDPPYPGEFLPLFSELSALAARTLKPGGLCLVYSGQIFLPQVMQRLGESLEYAWTFAIRHSGGNQRIFKVNVNTAWKPVLAFYKPPLSIWWDSFIDVVSGGREKDLHEWQQAESEAAYFIEHLTLPGQVVVDPFCGSGTVLKAAQVLGRQYRGIEINAEHARRAVERLS